jgi:DNA-binding protein Fis
MTRLTAFALVLFSLSCTEKTKKDYTEAHALLDQYVLAFRQLAMQGSGVAIIMEDLKKMKSDLDALKSKVPGDFYSRCDRLLKVSRLTVTPDPEGKLRDTIEGEIKAFLKDVEGRDPEKALEGGLADVGSALVEEVLSLHMLLEGMKDRKAARKKYLEKHLGPENP